MHSLGKRVVRNELRRVKADMRGPGVAPAGALLLLGVSSPEAAACALVASC